VLIFVLAATCAAAQGLEGPKPRRLEETVRYLGNDGKEVATCLQSATLPPRGAELDVNQTRIVCTFADGARLAWHLEFEAGTTGDARELLVDVATGSWLELTDRTAIEPRRRGESSAAWKARLLAADSSLTTIRVESDQFRLDAFRESEAARFRAVVWRRLEADEPTLARFIQRLVATFGKDTEGIMARILASVTRVAYAGPAIEPSELTVRREGQHLVALDAEDETFTKGFGRWASFPDYPRLHE
jgi:hypothetical protein